MDAADRLTGPRDEDPLVACAREPIHLPGAIQPHGILLGYDAAQEVVEMASANAPHFFGRDAVQGATLEELFGPEGAGRVRAMPASAQAFDGRYVEYLKLLDGAFCEAVRHETDGLVLLELMREAQAPDAGFEALRIQATINRLMSTPDLEALLRAAADEVRALTGFDRVDVYQFDPEWNGEVVAEALAEGMPAYLGLHFPASDIPPQARALYMRNRIRLIPDATYAPVALEPPHHPRSGAPLDLSMSVLRSVSPVHLEYLANMGVQASMSVSILQGATLWGLIACHHRVAHPVPFRVQASCTLIGQVLGMLVDRQRATENERVRAMRQRHMATLLDRLLRSERVADGLAANGDLLMKLVDATGVAICGGDDVVLKGETPSAEAVMQLSTWIGEQDTQVYASDALGRSYPEGNHFQDVASGVMAVTLARRQGHTIIWFRPEQPREVVWAGAPEKARRADRNSPLRLHPRLSFERWRTLLGGQSRPWTEAEREAVLALRSVVLDLVYERVETIQRLNGRLRQANESLEARNRELQDFAFVASHDLREPLRKIHTFSDLLRLEHVAELSEGARQYVGRMEAASMRAMHLVDDLLQLSRVGTHAKTFRSVDLGAAVEITRSDLELRLAEASATFEVPQEWPALHGDQEQIVQALRMILDNAVKFRAPARPLHVRIEATTRPGEHEGDPPRVLLQVHDNGIGFEERFCLRIFKPFERLNPPAAYPGTGMGLAIVRRIVERHGGRVSARSVFGEGSVFEIDLPAVPESVPAPPASPLSPAVP